jgi:putative two-component system response regulator
MAMLLNKKKYEIWVIDDSRSMRDAVSDMLKDAGYTVSSYSSPEDALPNFPERPPHVIISDIKMPDMDGIEFLQKVRRIDAELPFVLMTAFPELDDAVRAIEYGVFDFMAKPVRKEHFLLVVRRAVEHGDMTNERKGYKKRLEETVKKRTFELEKALHEIKDANLETILVLTKACEYRDDETAAHIKRIGLYACRIADALGMEHEFCETILHASPMHDVGKMGISDSILLKPGPLDEDEFEVMKMHTEIGSKMFEGSRSNLLKMAREIALCHHEKWDGTGYPGGLKGKEIPLPARIVMLADVYDALRSERPYKKGLSHEEAFLGITEENERTKPHHFDPDVLRVFKFMERDFDRIFNEYNPEYTQDRLLKKWGWMMSPVRESHSQPPT